MSRMTSLPALCGVGRLACPRKGDGGFANRWPVIAGTIPAGSRTTLKRVAKQGDSPAPGTGTAGLTKPKPPAPRQRRKGTMMKLSITVTPTPPETGCVVTYGGRVVGNVTYDRPMQKWYASLNLSEIDFAGGYGDTPESAVLDATRHAHQRHAAIRRNVTILLAAAELDPLAGQPVQRLGRDPYEWQDTVAINIIHDHEPSDGVTPPSDDWHVHPDDETLLIDANETATQEADAGGAIPLMMVCRRMVGDTLPVEIICEYELVELHRLPSRVVAEYELSSIR